MGPPQAGAPEHRLAPIDAGRLYERIGVGYARHRRSDPFFRFLVFWTIASMAIYGWAREKVPWLTVHPLLPITILAAIGLSDLWRDRSAIDLSANRAG